MASAWWQLSQCKQSSSNTVSPQFSGTHTAIWLNLFINIFKSKLICLHILQHERQSSLQKPALIWSLWWTDVGCASVGSHACVIWELQSWHRGSGSWFDNGPSVSHDGIMIKCSLNCACHICVYIAFQQTHATLTSSSCYLPQLLRVHCHSVFSVSSLCAWPSRLL